MSKINATLRLFSNTCLIKFLKNLHHVLFYNPFNIFENLQLWTPLVLAPFPFIPFKAQNTSASSNGLSNYATSISLMVDQKKTIQTQKFKSLSHNFSPTKHIQTTKIKTKISFTFSFSHFLTNQTHTRPIPRPDRMCLYSEGQPLEPVFAMCHFCFI